MYCVKMYGPLSCAKTSRGYFFHSRKFADTLMKRPLLCLWLSPTPCQGSFRPYICTEPSTSPPQKTLSTKTGLRECLEWGKSNGIQIAICSNDNSFGRLREILKQKNLEKYFNPIVISTEINLRKPDYRCVKPILDVWKRNCNIHPYEIAFVGDKVLTDILCAKYIGMRSIWAVLYNRNDERFKKKTEIDPNYEKKQL